MKFIDSHTHIDFSVFDNDRSDTLKRAENAGLSDIIISATTADRWAGLKNTHVNSKLKCHYAYGLHPMFMDQHNMEDLVKLKEVLVNDKAVAVGEIGLDFFIENPEKAKQIEYFQKQLEIADQLNLPIIVHARKSQDIVLKHLRKFPNLRGSLHSFSGSEQQAKQLIDLGFYLGFGGPITYTRATRLRKLVSSLPSNSLLIETDSPDQPDTKHYGERNEPAFLPNVAKTIAELRDMSIEEVAQVTTQNAKDLFNI